MTKSSIKTTLSSACCCLLGSTASAETKPWFIDLGLMNYIEQDRNTGIELLANAKRSLNDVDEISLQVDLDVITGATPNGASASNVTQSFTMASGYGTYDVSANELPADDTHMDIRSAFSLFYNSNVKDNLKINYSSHISMEFDYLSMGGGVEFLQDFNQHNSTFIAGTNIEYNRVHPVGGLPVGFATMQPAGVLQPRSAASASRRQTGLHIGINQIINKNSLMQIKYSWANASGYLTDPYKILSEIDDQNLSQLGSTLSYVYENRPAQREIQNIYFAYKLLNQQDVIDISYRYYWDEWDIKSHTIDTKYRYKLNNRNYLQPHLRFYDQSAANFYRHSLRSGDLLPEYASADFRLAKFNAYTIGLKYGKSLSNGREHSIGLEYYTQRGNSHPDSAIGLQKSQDLFPDLHTIIIMLNYSYIW